MFSGRSRIFKPASDQSVGGRLQDQGLVFLRHAANLNPSLTDRHAERRKVAPEALDMLKAWNTGHPGGIATLHANSALGGLSRLEQLIGEASAQVPHDLIAETIDCVVYISRRSGIHRVETVARMKGLGRGGYDLAPVQPDLQLVLPSLSLFEPLLTPQA